MAVSAVQDGIDPIGACVGQRGVRIQAVTRELNGERVDIIEWNPDNARFIANSLQPAKVLSVKLREDENGDKVANVTVEDDQLSLAIGKEGQNARLAAKLTGWRIDIKKVSDVRAEADRLAAAEAERLAAMTPEEIAAEQVQKTEIVVATPVEETQPEQPQEEPIAQAVEEVASATEEAPVVQAQEAMPVAAEEPAAVAAPAPAEVQPEVTEVEEEPKTFAEALAAFEAEEDEDLTPEEKLKRKADKRKRQTLVYDEKLGKIVAKKKHKSGRQDWSEEVEEVGTEDIEVEEPAELKETEDADTAE
jgi:N utilization substance protein A